MVVDSKENSGSYSDNKDFNTANEYAQKKKLRLQHAFDILRILIYHYYILWALKSE